MAKPPAPRPAPDNSRQSTRQSPPSVEQLKALAWLLDSSIRLPGGFRIGVEALLGLIPVIGDTLGVLLSSYIVGQAARLGVPRNVLLRMAGNIAIEGIVGLVPLLGDVFDAGWKANQRNVRLLLQHFEQPQKTNRSSTWAVVLTVVLVVIVGLLLLAGSVLLIQWLLREAGIGG